MKIRPYQPEDCAAVAAVFTESVHGLARERYTEPQLHAWAPKSPDLLFWQKRLAPLHTLLAQYGTDIAGFISFEKNGHIDLLYSHPGYARRGVARQLYLAAEPKFASNGTPEAFTEASLAAKPFFERMGFHVVEEQHVPLRGFMFRRFAMRKSLRAIQVPDP